MVYLYNKKKKKKKKKKIWSHHVSKNNSKDKNYTLYLYIISICMYGYLYMNKI